MFILSAQSTTEVLLEANALFNQHKEAAALAKYMQVLGHDSNNLEALVTASFLSGREGFRLEDGDKRKEPLYRQGMEFAERAYRIAPDSADVNYVMGVATGRMIELLPVKQKVEASRDVKKYAERAIQLNRKHYGAWHLLGLWHYGVKDLSGTKLFLISLIYGGMPRASYESAIDCFRKAIQYEGEYIVYRLDLAKSYLKLGRKEDARVVLEEALQMPPLIEEDPANLAKCRELLAGLQQ